MISRTNVLFALLISGVSWAAPISREVPQEHSHEAILRSVKTTLDSNNPDNIQDTVFGLLGNAAAAAGQGSITDTDCLQQATADQAFTNAKAAGDVQGMTDALIYRALERNTGKVGLASAACTSIQAVNPEIAAIQQHQDPASSGAAATNKQIVLTLAQQIASIGGDPQAALQSGTFRPGDPNDATGKGNSCDDANDAKGCIVSQNLLVEDATAAEINAAVAGGAGTGGAGGGASAAGGGASAAGGGASAAGGGAGASGAANSTSASGAGSGADASGSVANAAGSASSANGAASGADNAGASTAAGGSKSAASGSAVSNASGSSGSSAAAGGNLQTFTGTLGGAPPPVTAGGKGFQTDGSDFVNIGAAIQRSCDVQHNACANAANSGGGFSVAQCDQQDQQCVAAGKSAA